MYDGLSEKSGPFPNDFGKAAMRAAVVAMMSPDCKGQRSAADNLLLLAVSREDFVTPLLNLIGRFDDPRTAMNYYHDIVIPSLAKVGRQPSPEQEIRLYTAVKGHRRADESIKELADASIRQIETSHSAPCPRGGDMHSQRQLTPA